MAPLSGLCGDLQHRFGLAAPEAGHLCGKQLPGEAAVQGAAGSLRKARGLVRKACQAKFFLVECTKSTGAVATSEQAMPLPSDSQPAAREARAVHTADIHISEPSGTDVWLDIRVGVAKPDCSLLKELGRTEQENRREYGLGASNSSTLFDGVVPVIFAQHGCPGPCAIIFLNHIFLRRRVLIGTTFPSCTWGRVFQECCPIIKFDDGPKDLGAGRDTARCAPNTPRSRRYLFLSGLRVLGCGCCGCCCLAVAVAVAVLLVAAQLPAVACCCVACCCCCCCCIACCCPAACCCCCGMVCCCLAACCCCCCPAACCRCCVACCPANVRFESGSTASSLHTDSSKSGLRFPPAFD